MSWLAWLALALGSLLLGGGVATVQRLARDKRAKHERAEAEARRRAWNEAARLQAEALPAVLSPSQALAVMLYNGQLMSGDFDDDWPAA